MTDAKSLIDLSTAVEPSLPFTVDGEVYELRTISHLSKMEEARLRTLNKQEEFILAKIEAADPEKQKTVVLDLHKKLFDLRIELITMMTSLPQEKAEALPPMMQQKLIVFVGLEVGVILKRQAEETEDEENNDDDDEDEGADDKSESTPAEPIETDDEG